MNEYRNDHTLNTKRLQKLIPAEIENAIDMSRNLWGYQKKVSLTSVRVKIGKKELDQGSEYNLKIDQSQHLISEWIYEMKPRGNGIMCRFRKNNGPWRILPFSSK